MRIFVTYRREDTSVHAGRLSDALAVEFGEDRVFQDVAAIAPGEDFAKAIEDALDVSDVVLVVVGPRWLEPGREGTARIHQPDDYVRIEIAQALQRDLRIIPVLVSGASPPAEADLPEEIRPLSRRQAVRLSNDTWREDVNSLVRSIRDGPRSPTRRRLWPAAIVAVLLLLGIVGLVASLTADENGSSTEFAACETPEEPEWTRLTGPDATGSATVETTGGSYQFVVTDAHYRDLGEDQYEVVLATVMTNDTPEPESHGYWYYEKIEVAGFPFVDMSCFENVQSVIDQGQSSRGLVGFQVSEDPNAGVRLVVGDNGNRAVVSLHPTS